MIKLLYRCYNKYLSLNKKVNGYLVCGSVNFVLLSQVRANLHSKNPIKKKTEALSASAGLITRLKINQNHATVNR